MTHHTIRSFVLANFALAALPLGACAQSAFDPVQPVVLPEASLDFQNINPMIKMAAAYGDRSDLELLEGGLRLDLDELNASGRRILAERQLAPVAILEMVPGSYWYVPAGAVHATACISDEPCEFYFHAESVFDFTPVE